MENATSSVEAWSGKGRGDENFPVGVLIRPSLRRHVHAYYAFARNADDIADSPLLDAADKLRRLEVMRRVMLGEQDNGAPSAIRLRGSFMETGVPIRHATDLLVAFRQDVAKRRYASWDELMDYCGFSAAPVGRYLLALHDEPEPTHAPSDALCASLQVLNHLQDMAEDLATLDRCYLPCDLLAARGASIADLRSGVSSPSLDAVRSALLDRCDALNARACALPGRIQDRWMRLEASIIVDLARRLADRLRRRDPLANRVRLARRDVVFSVLAALPSLLIHR